MSKRARQIAIMWMLVIEEILRVTNTLNVRFGIGFLLDRSDRSPFSFSTEAQGRRYFLVNPFGEGLAACKTIGSKAFDDLVASACHEIAHVGSRYHDVRFLTLSEQIVDRTSEDIVCIKRRVLEAMHALCSDEA